MLVLSRKANERVLIDGGAIVVTVVELCGDKVRLGFDAPRRVSVHREEVAARIEAQKSVIGPDGKPAGHREPESTA